MAEEHSTPSARQEARDQLEADMERFIAAGGKIQVIEEPIKRTYEQIVKINQEAAKARAKERTSVKKPQQIIPPPKPQIETPVTPVVTAIPKTKEIKTMSSTEQRIINIILTEIEAIQSTTAASIERAEQVAKLVDKVESWMDIRKKTPLVGVAVPPRLSNRDEWVNREEVKNAMKKNGISIVDVTNHCGFAIGSLNGYLSGKTRPTPEAIAKIEDYVRDAIAKKGGA